MPPITVCTVQIYSNRPAAQVFDDPPFRHSHILDTSQAIDTGQVPVQENLHAQP